MIEAKEFKRYLDFAYKAHQKKNEAGHEYRQNGLVPYLSHPLGSALLVLGDRRLPYSTRQSGFKALLLHDVLEDTSLELPHWVEPSVKKLVAELTYDDFDQAMKDAHKKRPLVKLLMLADKVWTMYEDSVRTEERRPKWKKLVLRLTRDVKRHYGNTRVVQVAETIAKNTDW